MECTDAHLIAQLPLDPTTPDIDAKLTATLSPNKLQPSKRVNKKPCTEGVLSTVVQNTPAPVDDNANASDADNNTDRDDAEASTIPDWIDVLVEKPPGERGCKTREGRPGWGKPEILEAAGITEAQYTRYMASFFSCSFC